VKPATGSITLNFPDVEPGQLVHSCALDLAEYEHTLDEVGEALNVTRERVRQLERHALELLNRGLAAWRPEGDVAPVFLAVKRPGLRADFGKRKHVERDATIMKRFREGVRAEDLAAEYGLSKGHIKYIAAGNGPRTFPNGRPKARR
jgi:hypothetical protein